MPVLPLSFYLLLAVSFSGMDFWSPSLSLFAMPSINVCCTHFLWPTTAYTHTTHWHILPPTYTLPECVCVCGRESHVKWRQSNTHSKINPDTHLQTNYMALRQRPRPLAIPIPPYIPLQYYPPVFSPKAGNQISRQCTTQWVAHNKAASAACKHQLNATFDWQ